MLALVGPSGCGKSTLLRLIAGLDEPTAGELRVDHKPIAGPSAERGLMFQEHSLFPWLTVRRNIQSGLAARGVLRERRHEVDEFMKLTGLTAFAGAYPHQLSGGMAQRAALARALVNHPRILLLDEPLGALDQFTRMRMQDEILKLWEARGTATIGGSSSFGSNCWKRCTSRAEATKRRYSMNRAGSDGYAEPQRDSGSGGPVTCRPRGGRPDHAGCRRPLRRSPRQHCSLREGPARADHRHLV
jgi:predicted ABC-type transport system involved in lysophospholipase L1 biosynthesis ATPase subunit